MTHLELLDTKRTNYRLHREMCGWRLRAWVLMAFVVVQTIALVWVVSL